MMSPPQKEHDWLQKFVGEWTYESDCSMGPDQPRQKFNGTERVRSIGGLWIVGESQGEMPDGDAAQMIITIGYDPKKGRYVGTWIGSMMTHLWIYEGEVDAAGKVLTLNAEGPSMIAEGKMAKYQDIVAFKSDDHRVLTSRAQGDDGHWHEFMTCDYRRAK